MDMKRAQMDGPGESDWRMAMIASATRAPSSHNTQPWSFQLDDGGVTLHADGQRRLPVNDPADRELTISCGCALMNLRVAVGAANRSYRVDRLPTGDRASRLARLDWREEAPDAEEASLAAAIARRRTVRERFAPSAVPREEIDALETMAASEGARLQVIEPGQQRRDVARLVAEGDGLQWRDADWRRELAAWIRPRRERDGLGVPGPIAPFARAMVRTFDMGRRVGRHDGQLVEEAPRLLLLTTAGDRRDDWLRAGEALERVLLAACQLGLLASYLNQPVQVAALRPRLQAVLGLRDYPQILMRLGYPRRALPATPRRPVASVIESLRD